ncbi:MAG TPA: hypothetical protein VE687_00115 [Stellaceae bacterium]|nr:hypothetical protein [Stellaceae bacterium]
MQATETQSRAAADRVVAALLDRHGRSYCEELGIRLETNTPSALFRWLCAALLFSARISAGLAHRAAKALTEQGWTTPRKMVQASWSERAQVLNRAGYARYDERTATMLGSTAEMLLREYKGDLRLLRERAGREPQAERRLLREFKGIGDAGADIFCREAQIVWDELYPFADKKALATASELGIASDVTELAKLVPRRQFPRLLATLTRTGLAKDYDGVLEQAASGS